MFKNLQKIDIIIEIFDEEDVAKPPIQMMIPIKLDEAGNILKEQSSNFETGTLVNYDSVNIYFDVQKSEDAQVEL